MRPATAETALKRAPLEASVSSLKRPNTAAEVQHSARVRRRFDFTSSSMLPTHTEEGDARSHTYATASVSSPLPGRDAQPDYHPRPSSGMWDERYMTGRAFTDPRPATGSSSVAVDSRPPTGVSDTHISGYDQYRPPSQPFPSNAGGPPLRRPSFPQPSPTAGGRSPRSHPLFSHLPPRYPDPSEIFRPPSSGMPYSRPMASHRPGSGNGSGSGSKITLPSLADMIGASRYGAPPPVYRPTSASSAYSYPPTSAPLPPKPDYAYQTQSAAAFEAKYSPMNPHTGILSEEDLRYYDYQSKARQYGTQLPRLPIQEVEHGYSL